MTSPDCRGELRSLGLRSRNRGGGWYIGREDAGSDAVGDRNT